MSNVRLGLVGCGRVAQRGYVPAAQRAAGVELVAVADIDRARCEVTAPGVRAYSSAKELIAAKNVDALVLATPASVHLDDARLAAEAGLPTLIEKPPALNAGQAEALASLDPSPWIGFNRRFEPAIVRLQAALPAKSVNRLAIEIHYRRGSWQPYLARYDALLDLGPHLIDLARWLASAELRRVRAIAIAERNAVVEIEFDQGHARVAGRSDRPYFERVEVRDCDGRVVARHSCGGFVQGILARLSPDSESPLVTSLALQLEAFARAARDGVAPPLATAADGLAVMTVIDAARRSAAGGGSWTSVELGGGRIR